MVSTGQCSATSTSCNPTCASGQACVGSTPACADVYDSSKLDTYPEAIGDYISVSPDGQGGFGIAYYDRTNGNLMIAQNSGGMWTTAIVDGESAAIPSGDCGIGASLFIDTNGDWNITYVNGFSEALQYVKVTGGQDGRDARDRRHRARRGRHALRRRAAPRGRRLAHDRAVERRGPRDVPGRGRPGTLHYAVGQPGAATGHVWATQAITQDGFAGAFSNIVVSNNALQLMSWWRVGGMTVQGDVRILAPQ